ncbi:MAG: hypothetical protein AAGF59_08415 [Pseudomonadota bacterium]
MRLFLLIAFLALPAAADDRAVFYGTWGTPQQCARAPIKPGATVLAEPFEIGSEWLKQGRVWCRLNWGPIQPREDGFFSGADVQCGEDSVRQYFLRMDLTGETLTLRWDLLLSNGPLARCPAS